MQKKQLYEAAKDLEENDNLDQARSNQCSRPNLTNAHLHFGNDERTTHMSDKDHRQQPLRREM